MCEDSLGAVLHLQNSRTTRLHAMREGSLYGRIEESLVIGRGIGQENE